MGRKNTEADFWAQVDRTGECWFWTGNKLQGLAVLKSAEYSDEQACFVRTLDQANVEIVARFTIDGDPASKARPRFTKYGSKNHVYTPQKTMDAERLVAWKFRQAAPEHQPDDTHSYGLACVFFPASYQRRDVDNMLKLVSDGLNEVAWADDAQVSEVTGRRGQVVADKGDARTEVLVYRIGPIRRPTRRCKQCDAEFEVHPSTRKVHCSTDCVHAARRKSHICKGCGKEFVRKASTSGLYCTRECRDASGHVLLACEGCGEVFDCYRSWQRKHNYCPKDECQRTLDALVHARRRSERFPGTCLVCGAGTTRKEYRRCNPCKRAGKAVPL